MLELKFHLINFNLENQLIIIMAEIKIKKKAPIWPWILLILIVIAGLFFLFFYGNTEDDDLDDNTTEFEEVTYLNKEKLKNLTFVNIEKA